MRPIVQNKNGLGSDDSISLRAAQYVRMSTDQQKYSTQNQEDAIADYAARHSLTIVRTYADEGRSGVRIDGRQALKDLLSDVLLGVDLRG